MGDLGLRIVCEVGYGTWDLGWEMLETAILANLEKLI